jgi:5'-nucleotidase
VSERVGAASPGPGRSEGKAARKAPNERANQTTLTEPLRVVITNDDGVRSPGICELARAAVARGWTVAVAAPAQEASGSSAAMTAVEKDGRVHIEECTIDGLESAKVYAVAASPAFVAFLAVRGAFGFTPDVVMSGVNRGANGGQAILHSGTVGAALTAANNGCRGLAVSLDVLAPATATAASGGAAVAEVGVEADKRRNWETAAALATDQVPWLMTLPPDVVLNLNVPDRPRDHVLGLRRGELARFGQVQMTVSPDGAGFVRLALTAVDEPVEPGTDLALLAEGYAAITPIRGVTASSDIELPVERRSG